MAGPTRDAATASSSTTGSRSCGPTAASRAASWPRRSGSTTRPIGYIERGEYSPSLHLALRIARFFGLPVEAVFSLEPFGPLGADALMARPGAAHCSQEPVACSRSSTSRSATGRSSALDGATFTAAPGRIVGFLGPNGAGKTTTMRCIFGLARPDRGEVRWDGRAGRPRRAPAVRLHARAARPVPADARRRAAQLLRPAARHVRARPRTPRRRRWLERMGLADRAKSKLEELSHGNQQRVQLATALVHDPELLVLDEPFSGLDPIGIATMTEVVRERAAAGVGVVFSSHQLDLVEDVCEDVVIIARGRIVAAGGIDELKAASGRQHLEVEVAGSDGALARRRRGPDRPRARRRPGQAARRRDGGPRRAPGPAARPPARSAGSPTSHRSSPSCSWRPSRPRRAGRGGRR